MFGLGYVGAVTSACMADDGHHVTGVDVNPVKLELMAAGQSPIVEKGLAERMARAVESGRLTVTSDHRRAVEDSELAIVCVGTPSRPGGSVDLGPLRQVIEQIGAAAASKDTPFTVAVRSTIPPGTMRDVVIPALEAASGRALGEGVDACFVPEFLREGNSVADYYDPPKVVIAASTPEAAGMVAELLPSASAPVVELGFEAAEMVKYVDNSWHGLKVGFANEIGRLAKSFGVDSREVMDAFKLDTKLNISPSYLSPGFAFGGSCLPKDLRALEHAARQRDVDLPILGSVLTSNQRHIEAALDVLVSSAGHRIGILGLSFKAGTDDLRESPMVELVERLIGKGYDVRIFDPTVRLAFLHGANREFAMTQIPHLARLMVESVDELVAHGEMLVIGTSDPAFRSAAELRPDGVGILDLAGLLTPGSDGVVGICW